MNEDPAALLPLDRAPRLFASTFRDWDEFARMYAGVVAPKAAVTPRIQALADEIAGAGADKRDKARRLYEWVSRRIRWVAIYLGNGSLVPHSADTVLANGYGDCKDQVVLLMALLRARGIAAEPVLVNLGPTYTSSGPPTYTAFNHAITYLPDWDMYADTTPGGAPFGIVAGAYGKPVLHAVTSGTVLGQVPLLPASQAFVRLVTTASLDQFGQVKGESVTETTGPYTKNLRGAMRQAQAEGAERAAARQLMTRGTPGTGAFELPAAGALDFNERLAGHFTLNPQSGWLDGDSFILPTGLRILGRPGEGLLGPIGERFPVTEPTPCYAGVQEEELRLQLPPGYRPVSLPRARTIQGTAFRYESQWSVEKNVIQVKRRFVSQIDQPLCAGPLRAEAAKALNDIQRDQEARISLEKDD